MIFKTWNIVECVHGDWNQMLLMHYTRCGL